MRLTRQMHQEDGFGIVLALMVVFIVFALGATWYGIAVHEIDEASFDRNRTQSLHAADAAVRQAMFLLANDSTVRSAANGAGEHTSGTTGSTCDLVTITSDGKTVGEYWIRITDSTPADTADQTYFIESWGWAPHHDARQAPTKKVEFEVTLIPEDAFDFALFAGSFGLTAGNRKEIHGDIYSGADLDFSNQTDVFDNGSFSGDGNVQVSGNLTVAGGANVYVAGTTSVGGYIDDNHPGDTFIGDVTVIGNDSLPGGDEAFHNSASFGGVIRIGGTLDPTSNVNGAAVVENATGLSSVPSRSLPTFTWNTADYSPSGTEYDTWSDFASYYSANSGALAGAHYIKDTGSYTWDLQSAEFDSDFLLAFDGQLTIKRTAGLTGSAPTPLTVALIGTQSTSRIELAQAFGSTEDLNFLIYSKGEFKASQQTTVYGAVVAESDISTQKLTLYHRRPNEWPISGFTFSDTSFSVEPGVWREPPPGAPTCNLP